MSDPTAPAVPRPAATVMVVRPSQDNLEVFMVRRHQASKFAADLFVFPGGTVRPDDELAERQAQDLGLDPAGLRAVLAAHHDPFAERPDGGLALWVAALRELFEEAGVLFVEDRQGGLLDLSDPAQAELFQARRADVQAGQLSLAALARGENLTLAADRLVYFSRWITPAISPRRFDTRFFVAELPTGQTAAHCQIETTDGVWVQPRQALDRQAQQKFPMMFVTEEHVKRLAEFSRTDALIEHCRGRSTRAVRPAIDPEGSPYLAPEQQRSW